MKVKVILVVLVAGVCSMSSISFSQTANKLPQGLWKVEKIIVEKNTNGKMDTIVYNSVAEWKNYIQFPQELEVKGSQTIVLHYANGVKQPVEYTIEGEQLMIITTTIHPYQYSVNGEIMTLTTTYNDMDSLHTEQKEHITENWIITLKK